MGAFNESDLEEDLENDPQILFFRAKITSCDAMKQTVKIESINKDFTVKEATYANIYQTNEYSELGYDDMVNMENLNEAELLYNIQLRFLQDQIYSFDNKVTHLNH